MSALTDLFTSLANKIRSKLDTTSTYTPAQAIAAIDNVYNKGVSDTKKGDAAVGDVKSGKTFTSANGVELTGTFAAQTKSVTPSTSAQTVSPDSGKYLSSVSVSAISTQTKSANPSTSDQTISPDSGKYLSSVSISAISPQRSAGTAASASGRDSTGPYVYFPYGWWSNYSSSRNYTRLTEAQAIAVARTQTKTVTSSTSAQTVSPDSNYLLSKVTVNALTMSGTYTPLSTVDRNSSACDMGSTNTIRYVNTAVCYNEGYTKGSTNANSAWKAKRMGFSNFQNSGDNYTFDLTADKIWMIISETNSFSITSGSVSAASVVSFTFLGGTRYMYCCYTNSASKIKVKNSTALFVLG